MYPDPLGNYVMLEAWSSGWSRSTIIAGPHEKVLATAQFGVLILRNIWYTTTDIHLHVVRSSDFYLTQNTLTRPGSASANQVDASHIQLKHFRDDVNRFVNHTSEKDTAHFLPIFFSTSSSDYADSNGRHHAFQGCLSYAVHYPFHHSKKHPSRDMSDGRLTHVIRGKFDLLSTCKKVRTTQRGECFITSLINSSDNGT